ncbi:MAG: bifunctional lysylphosphatidylglycerol flippase/synthetase MprF [Alphaproteobacteria bacterium]|nr:bifunctional lysylphosphatidylglycerol flippase/synthetase MprF [Alphaproteobacteria bacterium]
MQGDPHVELARAPSFGYGRGRFRRRSAADPTRLKTFRLARSDLLPSRGALTAAVAVIVAALVAVAIAHLVREVTYADVMAAIAAVSWRRMAAAAGFTALSFLLLTLYDVSALAYAGRRLPYRIVGLVSFGAYAVSNTAGFGPLTGGAIRYRFLSPLGLGAEDVGRVVAFVTTAFGVGLAGVTALALLVAAPQVAPYLGLPPPLLRLAGGAVLAMLLGAVAVLARRGGSLAVAGITLRPPSIRLMTGQFAVTFLDVVASAAVLWVLLPDPGMGLPGFVAIYACAIGLGVLSHLPGGIGVFETVIVALVGRAAPLDSVLSALLLYRIVYHVLPLLIAALGVALLELRRAAMGAAVSRAVSAGVRLAPPVLGALCLVLGAMLIFSGVTPAAPWRLEVLAASIPLPLVEGAHFLASVLGLGMIIAARGLSYRLDGAWYAALVMSAAAIVLSLIKGIAAVEASLLVVLVLSLAASRREFTCPASLTHQALTPMWLAALCTVLIAAAVLLFFVYRDVAYGGELWWQFEFSAEAPRSLRAMVGVCLAAGATAGLLLLRPVARWTPPPGPQDLERALAIADDQSRPDAELVRLGDKNLMFSADKSAFIMYARQGRSWVALADPVGPAAAWPALVWSFVEAARAEGGRPVFYQATADGLGFYADAGLRAFRLGEEARVRLPGFDLKGAAKGKLRNAVSRGTREGAVFSVLSPEAVAARMGELRAVSDGWLAMHRAREKRFSIGAFEAGYVLAQTVAVLERDGRIVAFLTVMTTGRREEAAVDLMRFTPDAPYGAMEMLFVRAIEHFRDAGFSWLNLGMAPLSGFSGSPAAPVWNRIGSTVFEHGERFYNFRGLRAFKDKFQPVWRPRYIAVAGSPAMALADAAILIGGGLKGVVGK